MAQKILILVVVAAMGVFCVTGCKKSPDEGGGSSQAEIKTSAEYEAEAEKEITAENMAEELEKMEKELDAELSQGQ